LSVSTRSFAMGKFALKSSSSSSLVPYFNIINKATPEHEKAN
jgi:hypothetical protein